MPTTAGPGVRDDSGAYPGCSISNYYDPLISKVSVWAPNRPQAIARMKRVLSEYVVTGIRTNLAFHQRVMSHPEFAAGRYDTGFIERHMDTLMEPPPMGPERRDAVAAAVAVAAARIEASAALAARSSGPDKGSSRGIPAFAWVAQHRARRRSS